MNTAKKTPAKKAATKTTTTRKPKATTTKTSAPEVAEAPAKKIYTVAVTPLRIDFRTDKRGTRYMAARVMAKVKGSEDIERTMMARGNPLAAVEGALKVGQATNVRVLFDRIPKGGEFFTAIDLPKTRKAAIAA